jgi:23S rRNA (cytosine1962-C5)-methyltransferase
MGMGVVKVQEGRLRKIVEGHPWVYRTEIDAVEGSPKDGDLVEVRGPRGKLLGTGVFNAQSMLTVRLLLHGGGPVDDALIVDRVRKAVAYRAYYDRPDTDSRRLIFGEADRLPGVIADQFADVIVLQVLSLGMERWQDLIARTLVDLVKPRSLLLRNDESIRLKEGLPLYNRVFFGPEPGETEILENGLKLLVDPVGGQKTGYYLDQKDNHAFLRKFSAGKRVLDCFSYVGGFGLNAAAAGALETVAVDISEDAVSRARANAERNGLSDRMTFVAANAFDYLREQGRARARFNVVVLDPPAFTKSQSARDGAIRGYKEINLSAMRLLPEDGILATHSCSFHMPESTFVETVLSAAHDLGRGARIIGMRSQAPDHPVLVGYPESHYLKSLWLQMLD